MREAVWVSATLVLVCVAALWLRRGLHLAPLALPHAHRLSTLLPRLRSGDCVLLSSATAHVHKLFMNTSYTHCGMLVMLDSQPCVFHTLPPHGCLLEGLEGLLHRRPNYTLVFRALRGPPLPPERLRHTLQGLRGLPYTIEGAIQVFAAEFLLRRTAAPPLLQTATEQPPRKPRMCSELLAYTYAQLGVLQPDRTFPQDVVPTDFAACSVRQLPWAPAWHLGPEVQLLQ